jgi:hypothetical protein
MTVNLPFSIDGDGCVVDPSGRDIVIGDDFGATWEPDMADFVVSACNSYHTLIAALEKCVDELDFSFTDTPYLRDLCEKAIREAKP